MYKIKIKYSIYQSMYKMAFEKKEVSFPLGLYFQPHKGQIKL